MVIYKGLLVHLCAFCSLRTNIRFEKNWTQTRSYLYVMIVVLSGMSLPDSDLICSASRLSKTHWAVAYKMLEDASLLGRERKGENKCSFFFSAGEKEREDSLLFSLPARSHVELMLEDFYFFPPEVPVFIKPHATGVAGSLTKHF